MNLVSTLTSNSRPAHEQGVSEKEVACLGYVPRDKETGNCNPTGYTEFKSNCKRWGKTNCPKYKK